MYTSTRLQEGSVLLPKKKPGAAPVLDPATPIQGDAVATIRTDMEAVGNQREHALASVPKSMIMFPEIPEWRILQSSNLPAEAMASYVNILHSGAFAPENRPRNFPASAALLFHHDSASRYAFLTGVAGWSVDGKMMEKVAAFGQNVFSLLGRAFRRRNVREAHAEVSESDALDDMGQGSY